MNNRKILILLFTLVLFVNYNNYLKKDLDKINRENKSITNQIQQEEQILKKAADYKKDYSEKLNKYLFSNQLNYSQTMGKIQTQINNSSKGLCKVKQILWAQSSVNDNWFDRLRMNISLQCQPNNFIKFVNKLRNDEKIYYFESLYMTKNKKKELLDIKIQLLSFREK